MRRWLDADPAGQAGARGASSLLTGASGAAVPGASAPPAPPRRWHATIAEHDRRAAIALHRVAARPALTTLLHACSRLADGPLWCALVLVLPLADTARGGAHAARLLATAAINLVLYALLKRATRRMRPFECCQGVRACTRVPDRFSFPSGHTLHATAFALLLAAFYPPLAWVLWPFVALVAVARVVLGVHYPGDVLAGAAIGLFTASAVLHVSMA